MPLIEALLPTKDKKNQKKEPQSEVKSSDGAGAVPTQPTTPGSVMPQTEMATPLVEKVKETGNNSGISEAGTLLSAIS